MMPHHSTLDHHIVHLQHHGSRVRIVANDDVAEAVAVLKGLFPHDSVLTTPLGCHHACIYTADAPASLVAERISEHLSHIAAMGDAEPAPLHPPGVRTTPYDPLPDFFGPERNRR
jgi:hypothetical protein